MWFYLGEISIWLFLIVMAILEFAPISWIFSTSLRNPSDSYKLPPDFWPTAFHWQNYLAVINSPQINFLLFFWNSLKIASLVTIAQLITCSMAGFSFARLRYPGRDVIFFVFLSSLMVPATVIMIPTFILIRMVGLLDSHWALILPATTSAFGVFLLRQAFMGIPAELTDAAKIDGASSWTTFTKVQFPLLLVAVAPLLVSSFAFNFNNFN
ncbi:MAG: carbohydrate ABC transporter permease, partial [Caldilinea sp.]